MQVLTPTLKIPRGGSAEVQFQFTIPFINRNIIVRGSDLKTVHYDHQKSLYISMEVHNKSTGCGNENSKSCDIEVTAFKRTETKRYETEEWKVVYKKKIYNRDNGDYAIIDKHITLRFATGKTDGDSGSKVFENLNFPDIKVSKVSNFILYRQK